MNRLWAQTVFTCNEGLLPTFWFNCFEVVKLISFNFCFTIWFCSDTTSADQVFGNLLWSTLFIMFALDLVTIIILFLCIVFTYRMSVSPGRGIQPPSPFFRGYFPFYVLLKSFCWAFSIQIAVLRKESDICCTNCKALWGKVDIWGYINETDLTSFWKYNHNQYK